MRSLIRCLVFPAIALMILTSCGDLVPSTTGSLTVNIAKGSGLRALIGPSLEISTFDLTLSCPGKTTKTYSDRPISTPRIENITLETGAWTILAHAKNAAGDIIGSGTNSVAVASGNREATVIVSLAAGNGSLTLTASWPASLGLAAPSLTGKLTAESGSEIALAFSVAADKLRASVSKPSIPAGSYSLDLTLMDGIEPVALADHDVTILLGKETSAAATFSELSGKLVATIIDAIPDDFAISFDQADGFYLAEESTLALNASTDPLAESYEWFIDGFRIEDATGASLELAGLGVHVHEVGLFVRLGGMTGSASVSVDVVSTLEPLPAPTFDPGESSSEAALNVRIACSTDGARIRYTTDGTEPSATNGTDYGHALSLTSTQTIRAFAYMPGSVDSAAASATFTITGDGAYHVGDTGPAGGIVFFVNDDYLIDGWRYLEAAHPETESSDIRWGPSDLLIGARALSSGLGDGEENCAALMTAFGSAQAEENFAVTFCDRLANNGFDDWFLPNAGELEAMYENLAAVDLGGFSNAPYWSSTEINAAYAEIFDFEDGAPRETSKGNTARVRAVRAFP
ncbi:MAG: chitobiase/beta-hexosaminidase C-terminal domain-containing protein [Spirochaetaceae bacterium]|nr:chitobiase/beta-hexosaminidase C-terminal domain-containing protein [Spirochaetaceae bacterium]